MRAQGARTGCAHRGFSLPWVHNLRTSLCRQPYVHSHSGAVKYVTGIEAAEKRNGVQGRYAACDDRFVKGEFDAVIEKTANAGACGPFWKFVTEEDAKVEKESTAGAMEASKKQSVAAKPRRFSSSSKSWGNSILKKGNCNDKETATTRGSLRKRQERIKRKETATVLPTSLQANLRSTKEPTRSFLPEQNRQTTDTTGF